MTFAEHVRTLAMTSAPMIPLETVTLTKALYIDGSRCDWEILVGAATLEDNELRNWPTCSKDLVFFQQGEYYLGPETIVRTYVRTPRGEERSVFVYRGDGPNNVLR